MDATAWDSRYAGSQLVWSATPNAVVERETAGLPSGRAVDLASGEGRNAIWLASRGWQVLAVDFSTVATQRAARLARERLGPQAGRVSAVTADLLTWQPDDGSADLAVLAYLQLPVGERRLVHRAAAAALAPGGTFLLVAHHVDNLTDGVGGPQDRTVLFTEGDVVADLDGTGLVVDRAERVERAVAVEGEGTHRATPGQSPGAGPGGGVDELEQRVALDVLVRAHRPG